jgi:hypothetical protein
VINLSQRPDRQVRANPKNQPMSKKQRVAELRSKAAQNRAIARQSNDEEEAHRIFELAAKLEQQALDMDQKK